jgi:hypothetical protein
MAKLNRKLKKIFSINSPSDIGVWGSINTTTSTDPDVIQSTGYETGVSAAEVSGKKLLPRKDFNGVLYETSYHLAYLYQAGVPEYNAATTYYIGDIVRGDGTSFIYKSLADNNIGNALTSASWLLCGDLANGLVNDNLADNGDFIIAQRGTLFTSSTTFTNDDGNYTFDRFKVGNSAGTTGVIDVSQITNTADLPDGARAAISLLHQQADKQAYIAQYYDNDTTKTLLNKDVSLSFEIYNSDSVTRNFRAAILSWQGTADNMPFYPVTTWQTANDLIFDGNFTIENTTTTLTANATSWNRFTINAVNIDTANTNNLAVVIWTDEEMPNAYEWRATKIKLEQSSIATAWKEKAFQIEYDNCTLWAYSSYTLGVMPGTPNQVANDIYGDHTDRLTIIHPQPLKRGITAPTRVFAPGSGVEGVGSDAGGNNTGTVALNRDSSKLIQVNPCTSTAGGRWIHYFSTCDL